MNLYSGLAPDCFLLYICSFYFLRLCRWPCDHLQIYMICSLCS
nr:MAG TPA: hypothetical protein [Caudoviricetes sp.]DAV51654.1 MAG TPA: hypothetical protein [Caudoviricetes sp.]